LWVGPIWVINWVGGLIGHIGVNGWADCDQDNWFCD